MYILLVCIHQYIYKQSLYIYVPEILGLTLGIDESTELKITIWKHHMGRDKVPRKDMKSKYSSDGHEIWERMQDVGREEFLLGQLLMNYQVNQLKRAQAF